MDEWEAALKAKDDELAELRRTNARLVQEAAKRHSEFCRFADLCTCFAGTAARTHLYGSYRNNGGSLR